LVLNVVIVGGTFAFMKNFVQVYSKVTGKDVAVPDISAAPIGKEEIA
jgi:hypothetical protein